EGVFRSANPGRYFATGSATLSLPSSCNMRIAAPVTGFVIEAIQKSASGVIGLFAATSAMPVLSRWRSLSFVTTAVTAPEISFLAIISCMAAPIPGSFGPSANAGSAEHRAAENTRLESWECLVFILECCPARQIDQDRRFDADLGSHLRKREYKVGCQRQEGVLKKRLKAEVDCARAHDCSISLRNPTPKRPIERSTFELLPTRLARALASVYGLRNSTWPYDQKRVSVGSSSSTCSAQNRHL